VVLQFSIAITFIICTIIIYQQIDFGRKRDPGYNRDRLAFVYANGEINKKYALIRNELLSSGIVTAVTRSNSPISYTWNESDNYSWTGSNPNEKTRIAEFHIDNDFVETMGLKVISGREINTIKYPGDSTAILLNESAVKQMGFKEPIGQIIRNENTNWKVVGVIRNFVVNSPFYNIPPMILQGPKNYFGTITFRLKNQNSLSENMNKVEATFKKYIADYPIISAYVDEQDAQKLENERRTGIQTTIFGGLAILISCLGLFALAVYTAESRIREIGIRKVLGATVSGIIMLLSKDFVKLVIISFFIASPLAWWFMHSWLQNYTYRINIGWLVFMASGLFAIAIAIFTVSFQAFKAAIANPVNNLRSE
ncbi:MAG TPA: FtsX-like permease family protein, partial [Chitinophagaceae bacterium]